MAKTSLEERAQQLGGKLGQALSPILSSTLAGDDGLIHTKREQSFYNGKLEEVDGDCWAFSEATVADSFLSTPQ